MAIDFIFFNAGLELIPQNLRRHALIRKEWQFNTSKRDRGILLDGAIHSPLMDMLPDSNQRGRPDIIHHMLLNSVYSPLFSKGIFKVIIHTRENLCIEIPLTWRVPVNYNRFCGLFSQLLYQGRVPIKGNPILKLESCSLDHILQSKPSSQIILCETSHFKGEFPITIHSLSQINLMNDLIFLIGGYQSGDLNFTLLNMLKDSHFSIILLPLYHDVLPAWVIVSKIICYLEEKIQVVY
ncbi:hypothetical protein [Candidatus Hodarchaeum mangrovi]